LWLNLFSHCAVSSGFLSLPCSKRQNENNLKLNSQKKVILPSKNAAVEPWIEEFRNPAFYGDFVNQEIFPPGEIDMIPAGFRTPIPTKAMATIWGRSK
jgi:hypothetical protein